MVSKAILNQASLYVQGSVAVGDSFGQYHPVIGGKKMAYYLGIDISKAKSDVALEMNDVIREARFENTGKGFEKMERWLDARDAGQLHACMEATGRHWENLAVWLHTHEDKVSVVNPARIRHYARCKLMRTKTDEVDARLIADFCRTQKPKEWSPPRPEQRELRDMVRWRLRPWASQSSPLK
jgi:transposase